jgi:integrase
VVFYWRSTIAGKTNRVPIGNYDSGASPKSLQPTLKGYSVAAAMRAAEDMAEKHQANKAAGGYPALIASEVEAKRKAIIAKVEADKQTLESLLTHYCDHLEMLGRVAHKDARSIFKLHVVEAWPAVAALPANQVTGEQVADMMRRVLELGKGRTANKLRSYVRAAYQTARASRSKASVPVHFKSYNVTHNPAADTEPDESQNRADKHPLTAAEMRQYWQGIKALPGFNGAVLRLHLLTGGQRIEQLVNLLNVNVSGDSIMLFDAKGRPGKPPRPHTVPLIPAAAAALIDCKPQGHFALSTDGGKTHLAATTLSAWAVEAAVDIPASKPSAFVQASRRCWPAWAYPQRYGAACNRTAWPAFRHATTMATTTWPKSAAPWSRYSSSWSARNPTRLCRSRPREEHHDQHCSICQ